MITTAEDNSVVLNITIKQHTNEIAALRHSVDELLIRLEPVAAVIGSGPVHTTEPEPAPHLCDIAQFIHKETQHVACMISRIKSMSYRLQLPSATYPEDTDPVCRS